MISDFQRLDASAPAQSRRGGRWRRCHPSSCAGAVLQAPRSAACRTIHCLITPLPKILRSLCSQGAAGGGAAALRAGVPGGGAATSAAGIAFSYLTPGPTSVPAQSRRGGRLRLRAGVPQEYRGDGYGWHGFSFPTTKLSIALANAVKARREVAPLPFELVCLEVALGDVCNVLARLAKELELQAHPALEALTRDVRPPVSTNSCRIHSPKPITFHTRGWSCRRNPPWRPSPATCALID